MRFAFLLCAFVLLAPALRPVPALAQPPSDCSAYIGQLAKDLEINTTDVDDFASPASPTPEHVAQSAARYNRDAYHLHSCPESKRAFIDPLLTTWRAWVEHATTHENPFATTDLAARQLQKCTAMYSGGADGATCATWAKQVAKWQREWNSQ